MEDSRVINIAFSVSPYILIVRVSYIHRRSGLVDWYRMLRHFFGGDKISHFMSPYLSTYIRVLPKLVTHLWSSPSSFFFNVRTSLSNQWSRIHGGISLRRPPPPSSSYLSSWQPVRVQAIYVYAHAKQVAWRDVLWSIILLANEQCSCISVRDGLRWGSKYLQAPQRHLPRNVRVRKPMHRYLPRRKQRQHWGRVRWLPLSLLLHYQLLARPEIVAAICR